MATTSSGKKVCVLLITIPLLLLSLVLFVTTIGLGAWGIVRAQVANPCAQRNITGDSGCQPQTAVTILSTGGTVQTYSMEWTYWLGGASGVGMLWAIIQTFAGVALIATVSLYDTKGTKQSSSKEQIRMKNLSSAGEEQTDGEEQPEDDNEHIIGQKTITIGAAQKAPFQAKPVRMLTIGGAIGLFFSMLFFMLALLFMLWGIAISYDYARRDDGSVATFVVVEFITAIILPICLFLCGVLMAAVLDYITRGVVDMRTFIPKFLPVVKFETGTDKNGVVCDFWVIEDTFYFEVPRHNHDKKSFLHSFDHSSSTWFLNGIVCLGIHLAIAYFVDITLDTQTTIPSPERCDSIDSSFQCYIAGNLSTTECGSEFFNGTIHCFKFLRFGIDFDLIMALSTSYAFYLVASTAFTYLFSIVKIFLQIKPSKWWGILFVLVGIAGFIGGIILGFIWFYGYAAAQIEEILHFNIINLGQYFMVCAYIMIVGLLLLVAKWWENVEVNQYKPKVKKELIHYHDASRGEIQKAANEHAAELAKEQETRA